MFSLWFNNYWYCYISNMVPDHKHLSLADILCKTFWLKVKWDLCDHVDQWGTPNSIANWYFYGTFFVLSKTVLMFKGETLLDDIKSLNCVDMGMSKMRYTWTVLKGEGVKLIKRYKRWDGAYKSKHIELRGVSAILWPWSYKSICISPYDPVEFPRDRS